MNQHQRATFLMNSHGRNHYALSVFEVSFIIVFLTVNTSVTFASKMDIFKNGLDSVVDSANYMFSKSLSKACSIIGRECCMPPFVTPPKQAISDLKAKLEKEFFGQHLAAETVINALESHLNDETSSKALVLSFHGWAGSGKTFLSEQIMQALYKDGADSKFVKFYMASYHFPDPDKVKEYQEMLRRDIEVIVGRCEQAVFVFDEVDKTPAGIFDALVPFIQHPGKKFEGNNFKRAIFIFISNNGANDITRITLRAWKDGKRREDLTFRDFEKYLSNEAFNKKENGLYRSRIIDKVLVDFFVPFLPMQRDHVISCAEAEISRLGIQDVNAEEIADGLVYWPPVERLYSQTGCKKVEGLVKYYAASELLQKNSESQKDDINESSNDEL